MSGTRFWGKSIVCSCEDTTWGGLAQATGRGALIGAVGGAIMPGAGNLAARSLSLTGARSVAVSAGVNAAVGAGFTWASNTIRCRPTGPIDLLFVTLTGGAGSLLWSRFGRLWDIPEAQASAGRPWWGLPAGEALFSGTPYYTPHTPRLRDLVNPGRGNMNCVYCAEAADETMAGRPTTARLGGPAGWSEIVQLGTQRLRGSISNVVDDMSRWGEGARAIVVGYPRQPGQTGHAFNARNDQGNVIFLDAQRGIVDHIDRWRYYYLIRRN